MLARLLRKDKHCHSVDAISSKLYDNNTFYSALEKDIRHCRREIIIESPFITMRRLESLLPYLQSARLRNVNIIVNTRNPEEHENYLRLEAEKGVLTLQHIGVKVLFTVGHHRKIAIFDKQILWEGSLNILSQNDSCEIMRRTNSTYLTEQIIRFTGLSRYLR